MLAGIWVVVKQLEAGFRHQICPAMLVRVNFAVVGFKSRQIAHGFRSLESEGFQNACGTQHKASTNVGLSP